MKSRILIQLFLVIIINHFTFSQKLVVGEEVFTTFNSPHPVRGALVSNDLVWNQDIVYTEKYASYLAVHFQQLTLNEGDKLILRSPDNTRIWEYTSDDNSRGSFWSIPIYGNQIKIELKSSSSVGAFGYSIDKIARGFSQNEMNQNGNGNESICGSDDTAEAKCYETSEPEVYNNSRAVARLWLNGTVNCSGWLVGSEGHFMTCWHCIGNTNQANNTTVEMMAEGASCSTNCQTAGGCGGTIVADEVTLIQAGNDNFDWSLNLLPENVSNEYGFFQLRQSGAVIGERIYLPQHPAGFGKRIALESDAAPDTDGFPHIVQGNSSVRIGHHADTQGGSSGSPIVSYQDNLVIAVHEHGGCPNGGPNISNVIAALNYIPQNAIWIDCPAGNIAPSLSSTTLSNTCPLAYVDLNSIHTGTIPPTCTLIWSTDSDPANGVSPIINPIVSNAGTYYAYYFSQAENCFSPSSQVSVTIIDCCASANDITIAVNTTYNTDQSFGGNIIINSGATLTISDAEISFLQGKGIKIQSGGKLVVNSNSILKPCESSTSWSGITVNSGGELIIANSSLVAASIGIGAKANSKIDLNNVAIAGNNNFIGVDLSGKVNVVKFKQVTIDNYQFGIYSANGNSLYDIDFADIAGTTYGIYLHKSPAVIHDSYFGSTQTAIYVSSSPGTMINNNNIGYSKTAIDATNTFGLKISINTIGTQFQSGKIGVNLVNCNKSRIQDNTNIVASDFGIKTLQSVLTIAGNNISVSGANNTSGGGIQVTTCLGCQITNNYVNASQSAFGIESVDGGKNTISNNDVSVFSSISYQTAAIKTMGSNGETIKENIVNGVANTTGLIAQNSHGNTYDCNDAYNTYDGLAINHNSDGQDIKGNELQGYLDLVIRSVTGVQEHEGNEFYNGKARAYLNQADVLESRFLVNGTIPFHLPTDPLPANGQWFVNEPLVQNYYTCSGSLGPNWIPFMTDTTKLCAYFQNLKKLKATNPNIFWIKVYHLLKYEKMHKGYKLPDCIKKDTTITQLCAVVKMANVVSEIIAQSEVGDQSLDGELNTLSQLQQSYLDARDATDRAAAFKSISNLLTSIENSVNNELLNDSLAYDGKEQSLDSINCTELIVTKWKEIYKLLLNHIKKGVVDNARQSFLQAESQECSDLFGDAIHVARSLTATFDMTYYDVNDGCLNEASEPRSAERMAKELSFVIAPNPNSGDFTINFANPTSGDLLISDVNGKLVEKSKLLDATQVAKSLNNAGIYFVKVVTQKGQSVTHKMILIK